MGAYSPFAFGSMQRKSYVLRCLHRGVSAFLWQTNADVGGVTTPERGHPWFQTVYWFSRGTRPASALRIRACEPILHSEQSL